MASGSFNIATAKALSFSFLKNWSIQPGWENAKPTFCAKNTFSLLGNIRSWRMSKTVWISSVKAHTLHIDWNLIFNTTQQCGNASMCIQQVNCRVPLSSTENESIHSWAVRKLLQTLQILLSCRACDHKKTCNSLSYTRCTSEPKCRTWRYNVANRLLWRSAYFTAAMAVRCNFKKVEVLAQQNLLTHDVRCLLHWQSCNRKLSDHLPCSRTEWYWTGLLPWAPYCQGRCSSLADSRST